MKLTAIITEDYKGDPKIKITKDMPEITLTVYTDDLNLLNSWIGQEIEIGLKE